ncbi:hypothetical protein L596_030220 [Steinernema carpocapsae]|uniref:Uncharacterized protein n=1 Tax=Steinernema carpocapsae TaxID=34508 RepID=A0A4U5LS35_STECR|nr:hypothetical protein L596_030220 [Steinernema carpocapsae]
MLTCSFSVVSAAGFLSSFYYLSCAYSCASVYRGGDHAIVAGLPASLPQLRVFSPHRRRSAFYRPLSHLFYFPPLVDDVLDLWSSLDPSGNEALEA